VERRGLEERISKRALVYALMGVLGVTLIIGWNVSDQYTVQNRELREIKERLDSLEENVRTTARYVSVGNITLTFEAYIPIRKVPGNVITYLLGFATVSNLTKIVVRPITVNVWFEPNITQTGNGTITYDYTPSQVLEIASPDLDEFSLPWGAFPITLQDFIRGDQIDWNMTVRAEVEWMGYTTTQTSLTVVYKFIIG